MKILVALLNGLTLVVCPILIIGSMMLQPGDGGQAVAAGTGLFRIGAWFLCMYSVICIGTVFAKHKGPGVLAAGIVAHAFLLGFVVVGFIGRNSAPGPSCALAVVYAGLWIGMYSRLLHGQAYNPREI